MMGAGLGNNRSNNLDSGVIRNNREFHGPKELSFGEFLKVDKDKITFNRRLRRLLDKKK